jgi:hypothetical protein
LAIAHQLNLARAADADRLQTRLLEIAIDPNFSCSDGDENRNRSSYSLTVMTLLLEEYSARGSIHVLSQ